MSIDFYSFELKYNDAVFLSLTTIKISPVMKSCAQCKNFIIKETMN